MSYLGSILFGYAHYARPANLVILRIAALPKLPEKSPQKCYLILVFGGLDRALWITLPPSRTQDE